MNTLSRTRLFTLSTLACAALFLAACGQPSEEKDTGPNAGLSNGELLKKAVSNMKAMKSYHFEFEGGLPSESVQMSQNLSITADIQLDDRGSRIKMRDEGEVLGGSDVILDIGNGTDVIISNDMWFESDDGGKTWERPQVDTPAGYLMARFVWIWGERSRETSSTHRTLGERFMNGLNFKDGTPRIKQIDGIITRHMVVDLNSAAQNRERMLSSEALEGPGRASIWISTDITPTITQLRIEGSHTIKRNRIGPAYSVTFSPDGRMMAVAHGDSGDWTVRLWDLTKPSSPPRKLLGKRDTGVFSSVAFSPDGEIVAAGVDVGGAPTQLYLWHTGDFDSDPVTLPVSASVSSIAFRSDGKMLGAGTRGGVHLWEPPYNSAKPTVIPYPEQNVVYSVAFSPDNHTLATGNLGMGVGLHDVRNPEARPTILPHEFVREVAFSPDGHLLASAGGSTSDEGNTLKVWDLRQPVPVPVVLPGNEVASETVAFSPDGRLLAESGQDSKVRLWDLSHPMPVSSGATPTPTLALTGGDLVYSLTFSPDGRTLAAANSEGEVRLWNIEMLRNESALPGDAAATPTIIKEDEQPTDTPYTLTWKWSRFNEEFGEVKPPPTETIKSP